LVLLGVTESADGRVRLSGVLTMSSSSACFLMEVRDRRSLTFDVILVLVFDLGSSWIVVVSDCLPAVLLIDVVLCSRFGF